MTATMTATPATVTKADALPRTAIASSYLRAEWIKLRTVRSTYLALLAAAVAAIGIAALACGESAHHYSTLDAAARIRYLRPSDFDPASQSMIGNIIGQLAVGILGILAVTSEYASGMIRGSLAAMPNRRSWMAAKLAVFFGVALVAGQIMTWSAFLVGQAFFASQHIGLSVTDASALRVVVATGLYITCVGMLGAGLGFVIRHTTGAIVALISLTLVVAQLVNALPMSWQNTVNPYLPEMIGQQSATLLHLNHHFTTWVGLVVMAGYAAIAIAAGAWLLERRDA